MPSSRPSGTSPGAAGHFWAGRSSDTTGLAPSRQRAPASPHSAAGTPTSQAQQHFAQGSPWVAQAGTGAGSSGVNEVEMLRQQVAKLQATVAAQQATIQQLQVWESYFLITSQVEAKAAGMRVYGSDGFPLHCRLRTSTGPRKPNTSRLQAARARWSAWMLTPAGMPLAHCAMQRCPMAMPQGQGPPPGGWLDLRRSSSRRPSPTSSLSR